MKWVTRLIFALFLCCGQLTASIKEEPSPNIPISVEGVSTSRSFPKINPVTGEYIEEETDLIVAGYHPLSARRFYNHTAPPSNLYACWRLNPETWIKANFEYEELPQNILIGQRNGNAFLLEKGDGGFWFNPDSQTPPMVFSGQADPANIRVNYAQAEHERGNEKRFLYQGEIIDGSGCRLEFETKWHEWLSEVEHDRRIYTPERWIPCYCLITTEWLPNGNRLEYDYERFLCDKKYPSHQRIKTITAKDSLGNVMGRLNFRYPEKKEHKDRTRQIEVEGSDLRKVILPIRQKDLESTRRTIPGPDGKPLSTRISKALQIIGAQQFGIEHLTYEYDEEARLDKVKRPGGREFRTEYNDDKVAAQYTANGLVARFVYYERSTEVYDGEGDLAVYRFDENNRITAVERFEKGRKLMSTERRVWDEHGRLTHVEFRDETGECRKRQAYTYDERGNVIEERLGDRSIKRTFSDDGFNLKLSESDREGKIVRYSYRPGTNLLLSALTYVDEQIVSRIFYTYDEAAICVRTLIDDGSSLDSQDLSDITYRKITDRTPRKQLPCYGLIEQIEEKTVDAQGREQLLSRICYAYHPSGQIEKETHFVSDGKKAFEIVHTYDEQERRISTQDPLGHLRTFAYDANNNKIQECGPRDDCIKRWTYDLEDRVVTEEHSGLTSTNQHDKKGRLVAKIDPCGHITRFLYDGLDRVIKIVHPDGGVVQYAYDCCGNKTLEIDPNGDETRIKYNLHGQPIQIDLPDGTQERMSYNSTGTLKEKIDRMGVRKTYTYDPFDHLIREAHFSASGELLRFSEAIYTPFKKLSERDFEGIETRYTYDFAGRLLSKERDARTIHYTYDSWGRRETTQKGDLVIRELYDALNRVIEKRQEDSTGTLYFQEKYRYDSLGNRIETITCQGATQTEYNAHGRPIRITKPDGAATQLFYRYAGGLSEERIDPLGCSHIKLFDACKRLAEEQIKRPDGTLLAHRDYLYDRAGNRVESHNHAYSHGAYLRTATVKSIYGPGGRLERLIESESKVTERLYDKFGRLKTLIKPDHTQLHHRYDDLGRLSEFISSAGDIDYHYSYDKNDQMLAVTDRLSASTTKRGYNSHGQMTHETLAHGAHISHHYDPQGFRTQTTYPDGSHAHFSYQGGQLHTVSYNDNLIAYQARNLAGQPTQIVFPFGHQSISYDSSHRIQEIAAPGYFANKYTYDLNGRLVSYTSQDSLGATDHTYRYDELNQLTADNHHTYRHDSLYNRLEKDEALYTINTLSQLLDDGETAYIYDPNGNPTSIGTTRFVYDSLDRLIEVHKEDQTYIYRYDPFNRRLSKTLPSGETLEYYWDGNNEIGSSQGEWRLLGQGHGAEIGATLLLRLDDQIFFPMHDHRGALVALITPSGTVQENYRYDAFGHELTGNRLSPWLFAGKRLDPETDFLYFGRRYYSPQIGRWITPDPLGYADGPNLYAYVLNNPMLFNDLYGLWVNPFSPIFRSIEFIGRHFMPFEGVSHLIEGIGRMGQGKGFNWTKERSFIHHHQGRKVQGTALTFINGMSTSPPEAIAATADYSKSHGDAEVFLFYNASRGFLRDLINAGVGKLGIKSSFEKMTANFCSTRLLAYPDKTLKSTAHSRGGTRMMNIGKLLTPQECQRIHLTTYGSSTLVPDGFFGSVRNVVSGYDFVPWTNPIAFAKGLLGNDISVEFLRPTSFNPLKEHSLSGSYGVDIELSGLDFVKTHVFE